MLYFLLHTWNIVFSYYPLSLLYLWLFYDTCWNIKYTNFIIMMQMITDK